MGLTLNLALSIALILGCYLHLSAAMGLVSSSPKTILY